MFKIFLLKAITQVKYEQSQTSYRTQFEPLSAEEDSYLSGAGFCTKFSGIVKCEHLMCAQTNVKPLFTNVTMSKKSFVQM